MPSDAQPDAVPSPAISTASAPPVVLRGVVKRYGGVEALSGLDLTVESGQVYGFLGRNGAGKSTALRIMMGITRQTAGTVELLGLPVRDGDPAVRRRIGYVAQEQSFYGWMTPHTIGCFVAGFYPTWDDAEYRRLLGILDLPDGRRIKTFSGGMTTKLALALALAHQPELLVLDEPTAGMDAVARREFLELVRAQARRTGRTTLFSSHLIDEVELAADTIGIIDGGRMLWQGPAAELTRQSRALSARSPLASALPLPAAMGLAGVGVEVLEDRTEGDVRTVIVRCREPSVLAALDAVASEGDGWQVRVPTLEDMFVALVRHPIAY